MKEERSQMNSMLRMNEADRRAAERELAAAQTELDSLGLAASAARLERALERVAAARDALALAA